MNNPPRHPFRRTQTRPGRGSASHPRAVCRRSRRLWFALAATSALGCEAGTYIAAVSEPVVYGTDDRREPYEVSDGRLRAIAESAGAVMVYAGSLDRSDPANVRVTHVRTLGETQNLCPGESFASQINPGRCSGTLIDDRHVLTAAHCVDSPDDCNGSTLWVLGFRYSAPGVLAPLTSDDVYSCVRVVGFVYDGTLDHAVVELERPVVGHTPVEVASVDVPLAVGTPLTLIGHPDGIPMKVARGGGVLSTGPTTLYASVDAFHGNSGSGVFDAAGVLVAILVAGATDYVASGDCNVVNVLDPALERGELLNYSAQAITAMCATPGLVSPLCACGAPCVPAPPHDACATAEALPSGTTHVTGTLDGFGPDASGSCGGLGPERFYALTVDVPARVTLNLTGYDSVLYLLRACGGPELACNDDIAPADLSSRVVADLLPGTYIVAVDAYTGAPGVTFDLTIATSPLPVDAAVVGADAGWFSDAGARELDAGWRADSGPTGSGLDAGTTADAGSGPPDAARLRDTGTAHVVVLDAARLPDMDSSLLLPDVGRLSSEDAVAAGADADPPSPTTVCMCRAVGAPRRGIADGPVWVILPLVAAFSRRRGRHKQLSFS